MHDSIAQLLFRIVIFVLQFLFRKKKKLYILNLQT